MTITAREIADSVVIDLPEVVCRTCDIKAGTVLDASVINDGYGKVCLRLSVVGQTLEKEKYAQFVAKKLTSISGFLISGDEVTACINGKTYKTVRSKDDDFDMNVALCVLLWKAGITYQNPAAAIMTRR